MAGPVRELVERAFAAVEAKDLAGVLALFAEDAVLIDPHYPNPRMVGRAEIAEGMRWGFASIRRFGFTIVRYFASEDGNAAAVEVATAHELPNGRPLRFPQMFVFDTREGRIVRMEAYQPYGPHGIVGLILTLSRIRRRLGSRHAGDTHERAEPTRPRAPMPTA